jgi:hypothetical protein
MIEIFIDFLTPFYPQKHEVLDWDFAINGPLKIDQKMTQKWPKNHQF